MMKTKTWLALMTFTLITSFRPWPWYRISACWWKLWMGGLKVMRGLILTFAATWAWCCCRWPIKSFRLTELYRC